ncbi:hypothetical protein [Micromonospora auratinigra]|uniref:DUF1963 domain-containing protein n=1 Tax=Micromonospora auratinigra TaxID=261654 RepID=A0A1A9A4K6_9ACTN|nr:hypothetical protein [Micromonospora auratinigra]SBT51115.1 hypothetical protein GA0070611_5027 [Micromonospora auratinigra]
MYRIEITSTPAVAGDRNTVGGWPLLDADQPWPVCECGSRMALFFQLDVPADIPTFGGEHLLAFQCPRHNDACLPTAERLPPRYWEQPPAPNELAFWRVLLQRAGVPADTADPYLQPLRLSLAAAEERHGKGSAGVWAFKVGGRPVWSQEAEHYRCACGSDLAFLLQVPENFGFPKRPEAAEQVDTFNGNEYGMFLGNDVYLLACPARCDPAAVWPVNQN